jgi:hypothetical protein
MSQEPKNRHRRRHFRESPADDDDDRRAHSRPTIARRRAAQASASLRPRETWWGRDGLEKERLQAALDRLGWTQDVLVYEEPVSGGGGGVGGGGGGFRGGGDEFYRPGLDGGGGGGGGSPLDFQSTDEHGRALDARGVAVETQWRCVLTLEVFASARRPHHLRGRRRRRVSLACACVAWRSISVRLVSRGGMRWYARRR